MKNLILYLLSILFSTSVYSSQNDLIQEKQSELSMNGKSQITVGSLSGAIKTCVNQTHTDSESISNITHLTCVDMGLNNNDIKQTGYFSNLIYLDISHNLDITSIKPLTYLNSLKNLYLKGSKNIDLSMLANINTQLEVLNLASLDLTTIPNLTHLNNLSVLNMRWNNISSGFNNLPSFVKVLKVDSNGFENCNGFTTSAETLQIGGPNLKSIEGCENLTDLKYLKVIDAPDLEAVQNIDNFNGFCGLTFKNTSLEKIKGSRPVNSLTLTNNKWLFKNKVVKEASNQSGSNGLDQWPNLIPHKVNLSGSNNMECASLNETYDFWGKNTKLDMTVAVTTTVDGVVKTMPACPGAAPAQQFTLPNQCATSEETQGFPLYSDFVQEASTFITPQINSAIIPEEDGVKIPETYIVEIPNEKIKLQDLSVNYEYNDIVIPGPNGMDLVVKRKLGGFEMLSKVHRFKPEFCSQGVDFNKVEVIMPRVDMTTVGFSSTTNLPNGTLMAFTNGSVLLCNNDDIPIIYTSDGLTYTFSKTIVKANSHPDLVTYYVSTIEDRFGNTITYNYGEDFSNEFDTYHFVKLESISRNDGAQIDFTYETKDDGLEYLTKASYGDRETNYVYVKQQWGIGGAPWKIEEYRDQEGRITEYKYNPYRKLDHIINPNGLRVDYSYQTINPDIGLNAELKFREISGPDIETHSIKYLFQEASTFETRLDIEQSFDTHDILRVIFMKSKGTASDHGANEKHIDNVLVGRIVKDSIYYDSDPEPLGQNLSLIYSVENEWVPVRNGDLGCPIIYGFLNNPNPDYKICARAQLEKQTFKYSVLDNGGNTVFDTYISDPLTYDEFGFVTNSRSSTVNSTTDFKYTRQSYLHDTINWIIGLPTKSEISDNNSNWTETRENVYWSATSAHKSKIKSEQDFGRLDKEYLEYHANGDLKQVNTSGTGYYELMENYKYGIPQKTTIPGRYDAKATEFSTQIVNDFGEIISTTDTRGTTIDYEYDKLGRVTLVDYNECDPQFPPCTFENDITLYNDSPNTITKTKGNFKEISTYDELSRVIKTTVEDINNPSTRITVDYDYDVNGRLAFQSFPYNPTQLNGSGKGTSFEYDHLNRMTKQVIQDSSTTSEREIEYLSNQRILFTDGRDFTTEVSYESYGGISFNKPIEIIQQIGYPQPNGEPNPPDPEPVYVTTDISYNLVQNVDSISQDGVTETHIYNTHQQLCKIIRPDTGITAFGYNSGGLMTWQAFGTTGSQTQCGGESDSDKVSYTYDNQNEVHKKFDGSATEIYKKTVYSNGGTIMIEIPGVEVTSYSYNKRGQLNGITNGGLVTYGYDSHGHLADTFYPDYNSVVLFNSNALGQVTSLTENGNHNEHISVSNIQYHPSGEIKSYTMGNGIQRSVTFRNSGLPLSITDSMNGDIVFKHTYNYDNESNLISLQDGVNPLYDLTGLNYDGLGRLKSVSGAWGSANYIYDNLSNIKSTTIAGQNQVYNYDSSNRLQSVTGTPGFSFSYDTAGNVTSNGVRTFTYDEQNRMDSSDGISFVYNDKDLIYSKSVPGETTVKNFYGAENELLVALKDLSNESKYYYIGDQIIGKRIIENNVDELFYQHTDSLRSVSVETDINGTVVQNYHYEPFGLTLEIGQEDEPGFTGHIYDDDLGLNYMKARFYDPMIGRFYSNDPIGFAPNKPMTFNRYAYANNNPYKYIDPDGMQSKSPRGAYPWEIIAIFNYSGEPDDSPVQESIVGLKHVEQASQPVISATNAMIDGVNASAQGGADFSAGAINSLPLPPLLIPDAIENYTPTYPYWYNAGGVTADAAMIYTGGSVLIKKFGPRAAAEIILALSPDPSSREVGAQGVLRPVVETVKEVKLRPKRLDILYPKK